MENLQSFEIFKKFNEAEYKEQDKFYPALERSWDEMNSEEFVVQLRECMDKHVITLSRNFLKWVEEKAPWMSDALWQNIIWHLFWNEEDINDLDLELALAHIMCRHRDGTYFASMLENMYEKHKERWLVMKWLAKASVISNVISSPDYKEWEKVHLSPHACKYTCALRYYMNCIRLFGISICLTNKKAYGWNTCFKMATNHIKHVMRFSKEDVLALSILNENIKERADRIGHLLLSGEYRKNDMSSFLSSLSDYARILLNSPLIDKNRNELFLRNQQGEFSGYPHIEWFMNTHFK